MRLSLNQVLGILISGSAILFSSLTHAASPKFQTRSSQSVSELETQIQKPKRDERPFGVNGELFGRGGLYSLNVEFSPNREITTGVGISYQSVKYAMAVLEITSIPVYANWYFLPFWRVHKPFISAGVTVLMTELKTEDFSLSGSANDQQMNVMIKGMDLGSTTLPAPNAGLGYEYLSRRGMFTRAQVLAVYLQKIEATAGFSMGFRF